MKAILFFKGRKLSECPVGDVPVTIGRPRDGHEPDLAVNPEHKFISKVHGTIQLRNGGYELIDGEHGKPSNNGIWDAKTRRRVDQSTVIRPGAIYLLGNPDAEHYELHFQPTRQQSEEDDTVDFGGGQEPDDDTYGATGPRKRRDETEYFTPDAKASLTVTMGPSQNDAYRTDQPRDIAAYHGQVFHFRSNELTIGRDSSSDILLFDPDQGVEKHYSREHARIRFEGGAFWLDVKSPNGLRVKSRGRFSGKQVPRDRKHRLQAGDQIIIGRTGLTFEGHVKRPGFDDQLIAANVDKISWIAAALALVSLAAATFLGYRIISRRFPGSILTRSMWSVPLPSMPSLPDFLGVVSSPAVGDLNRDGFPDVVVGGDNGMVYGFDGRTGGEIWTRPYNTAIGAGDSLACGLGLGPSPVLSSPLLADGDGDGQLDVFIGTADGACGRLIKLNGATGYEVWAASAEGPVYSSPAAADLTGDGLPEILVGVGAPDVITFGPGTGQVLALRAGATGGPLWRYPREGSLTPIGACVSTPSVYALAAGYPAVVFGSNDGKVYAVSGYDGTAMWSFPTEGANWVDSSPATTDLNDDGVPDVVVSSRAGMVYGLDGRSGNRLASASLRPSLSQPDSYRRSPFWTSPVLTDLTGDGTLDVLVAGPGEEVENTLFALDGKNLLRQVWSFSTRDLFLTSTPALMDINRDGIADVILAAGRPGNGLAPAQGRVFFVSGADRLPLGEMELPGRSVSSPAVADLNADGKAEVILGGSQPDGRGAVLAYTTTAFAPRGQAVWPTLKADAARTGRFVVSSDPWDRHALTAFISSLIVAGLLGWMAIKRGTA